MVILVIGFSLLENNNNKGKIFRSNRFSTNSNRNNNSKGGGVLSSSSREIIWKIYRSLKRGLNLRSSLRLWTSRTKCFR